MTLLLRRASLIAASISRLLRVVVRLVATGAPFLQGNRILRTGLFDHNDFPASGIPEHVLGCRRPEDVCPCVDEDVQGVPEVAVGGHFSVTSQECSSWAASDSEACRKGFGTDTMDGWAPEHTGSTSTPIWVRA